MHPIVQLLRDLLHFYCTLLYYWIKKGTYSQCPYFVHDVRVKVHLFSIALTMELWDKPHYRSGTFHHDLVKNLRNVAIPGTGIPISWICKYKWIAYLFLLIVYPIICMIAALHSGYPSLEKILTTFRTQLLAPDDWFSLWRLNCCMATYHSLITEDQGYEMEDKWKLLIKAKAAGVPVSPWLEVEQLVVKDKNEEGGMGIHFYKNALHGGEWIIQEKLENSDTIKRFIPKDAPLSTFRVITASRYGLKQEYNISNGSPKNPFVTALSCVFRAGLSGASTDHESILFDVDLHQGILGKGTTNSHWYEIGLHKCLTTPWASHHDIVQHPDTAFPVTGHIIHDIQKIVHLCKEAHTHLLPNVPLAGWDVACTTRGHLILEANLSCNFFRGTFDRDAYCMFMNEHFLALETFKPSQENMEDRKDI